MKESKKSKGFTLAEVLVTLMIIGVIAAMTIPGLKKSADEQQYIAGMKKAYSVLSQAVSLSENDNGSLRRWNYSLSSEDFFNEYIIPYLNVNKYCGTSANVSCFGESLKQFDGNNAGYMESPKAVLSDGMRVLLYTQSGDGHAHFWVDVNGAKKPNKLGIDTFLFTLTPKALNDAYHKVDGLGLYYFGSGSTRDTLMGTCTTAGYTCGALIVLDGDKMKY